MNPKDFRSARAGKAIRTPQGYWAFVPAPLPPELGYEPDLVLALSQADAALSELSGLGRHLPNPRLLIAPYVRREAVLSSRIEGTKTNLADLLLEEVEAGASRQAGSDVREVRNYVVALEYGVTRLADLPLSLRLVRKIHARLMKGVRGDSATPGEFRRTQNWIGAPGSAPTTATYVPPPPAEMIEALSDWERFLHLREPPSAKSRWAPPPLRGQGAASGATRTLCDTIYVGCITSGESRFPAHSPCPARSRLPRC